jgi:transposase-like protein
VRFAGLWHFRLRLFRDGSFSTQLFDRYQRSEKALVLSLMQKARGQGVSTRRIKKISEQLCGRRFSRSTVSERAKGLDEQVEAWAERELGGARRRSKTTARSARLDL